MGDEWIKRSKSAITHVVLYGSKENDQKTPQMSLHSWPNSITKYKLNQILSNAYIWLKLGPFINIMQSDNDIQIWMAENDNIIEKVRSLMFLPTWDVIKRKSSNVGDREA